MALRFEWDPAKAKSNAARHGVTFDAASQSFLDTLAHVSIDQRRNYGEERLLRIAHAGPQLLFVCYTETEADDDSGDEIIRIISARKATSHERKTYQEG
jgi:uncharacterized protein